MEEKYIDFRKEELQIEKCCKFCVVFFAEKYGDSDENKTRKQRSFKKREACIYTATAGGVFGRTASRTLSRSAVRSTDCPEVFDCRVGLRVLQLKIGIGLKNVYVTSST